MKRLKLTDPIHDAGETIDTLEFGKPKARLFRLIESLDDVGGEQILAVVADLCDIGVEAAGEIDFADFEKAAEIAGELLQSKKKGRSSSVTRRRKTGVKR